MSSSHKRNPLAPLRCARHDALRTRGPCRRRQPATRACCGSTNEDRSRHRLSSPCVSPPTGRSLELVEVELPHGTKISYPQRLHLHPPTDLDAPGPCASERVTPNMSPNRATVYSWTRQHHTRSSSQPARLPDTPSRSPTPHLTRPQTDPHTGHSPRPVAGGRKTGPPNSTATNTTPSARRPDRNLRSPQGRMTIQTELRAIIRTCRLGGERRA